MPRQPGLLDRMRIVDNTYCGIESAYGRVEVRNSFFSGNPAASDGPGRVTGSTFVDNSEYGIRTRGGAAVIVGNIVRRNPTGIIVEEGTGTIARNFVVGNPGAGIHWNYSAAGAIRDNFVARNGYGITLHQEEYRANPIIERNVVVGEHRERHPRPLGRSREPRHPQLDPPQRREWDLRDRLRPLPRAARQRRVGQRRERHHRQRGVHRPSRGRIWRLRAAGDRQSRRATTQPMAST